MQNVEKELLVNYGRYKTIFVLLYFEFFQVFLRMDKR
jgi:hypothetical protein